MNAFTKADLKAFQSETLPEKEQRSLAKIAEWFAYWNNEVYVAFSGGKDSSVLADLCGYWCKAIGATLYLVFVNTGLEYPEIQKHVKSFAEYLRKKYDIEVVLEILYPKMRFDEVIKKYGYPLISKEVSNTIEGAKRNPNSTRMKKMRGQHLKKEGKSFFNKEKWAPLLYVDFNCSDKCCDIMKKKPCREYEKQTMRKPILGQLAEESLKRQTAWLKTGCNAFSAKREQSNPMAFWTEQDVLQYIKRAQDEYDREYKSKIASMRDPRCHGNDRRRIRKWLLSEYENSTRLPIASVYGDIEYANDPEQIRIDDLGIECEGCEDLRTTGRDRTGCIFCAFGCHREDSPNRFERLRITHPRQYEYCIGGGEYNEEGKWQPNKQGLGLGHVFDELNKIYGDDFIKY